ncbi:MAG: MFS transporter, partial [Bacteroidota bacterium]
FKPCGALEKIKNQLLALFFNLILILGHFTIIPFIAPYMELNIGLSSREITYIYLVGGLLTAILLPLVGKLSDRYGHPLVFTIASIAALGSIFWVTNLQVVSLWFTLLATSSFFVVASGRNVPALTMVTSVVPPENRGSFMSVRSSIQEAGLALSALIAGFIVVEDVDGKLLHYDYAGYVAIGMSILAALLAWRLKVVDA